MFIRQSIKVLLLTAALACAVAAPTTYAEDHGGGLRGERHFSPEQRAQWVKARLDHLANRLQITASQQPVWESFAATALNLAQHDDKRPAADADAATVARFHADRAAGFADKLSKLADATAKLQDVLDDNQRKILNQVSHLELRVHHGDRGEHGHHGFHGERGDD